MTPSPTSATTEPLRAIMRSFELSVSAASRPATVRSRPVRSRARVVAFPVSPIRSPKS